MDENKELIKRIKNGDDEAFNKLLTNHRKMIYKIINTFNTESGDYSEDVESMYQEGCIALYNAVFSYEEERGAKFSSYAYISIRSKVMSYLRKNSNCRKNEYYSIDLNSNVESQLSIKSLKPSEDPVYYHKEMEFKEFLDNFIKALPDQDRKILTMRNENHTYKEISEELHISTKKVDNKLRTIRKKLKNYIKEEKKK